ncbi:MAG: ABC transporter permease [Candidatus Eremiobacteraeota bacterium]|nr:ABC transporter permease [Candidatus Eremiobacteraeota bacterium]MBV8435864.1 ABC transporter permease [Candidatus Eremiobacteraeota bacterium]MBV8584229.1 ABC transporter permease [Candidatus Eremiobacteraeota bacterium]MBV8655272.1 ABC transporter permease [Candidatus Eremiobacteraeota bacterium]
MDWGKVKFFLGEVLRNFTRNAGMQATAIGTVAITIVLLGVFLFVRGELTGLGTQLLDQIEISAYLSTDATPAQIASLRRLLAQDPRVVSVDFIPKKQGLAELRDRTKGAIDTSTLTENPLPDKLRVRVRVPDQVPAVAASVRRLSGVDNVVYGQTIVARLLQLGDVLRRVGIAVILVFFAVAGIIISNTIRLTVFARRREIAIMQLVGATNTYIRMPFICEGMLDGVVGALLAVGLLAAARATLWPRMVEALPWVAFNTTPVDVGAIAAELLLVGAAIGVVASWISVGRHLRT